MGVSRTRLHDPSIKRREARRKKGNDNKSTTTQEQRERNERIFSSDRAIKQSTLPDHLTNNNNVESTVPLYLDIDR